MSHVDEGLIHAWLENQLEPAEAARVERLVASDPEWGAAAAEARGLIAASSRVLGALDPAPAPTGTLGSHHTVGTQRVEHTKRKGASWARSPWLRAAAAIVLVAGVSGLLFTSRNEFNEVGKVAVKVPAPDANVSPPAITVSPPADPVTATTALPPAQNGPGPRQKSAAKAERPRSEISTPPAPPSAPPPPATTGSKDETIARGATSASDSTNRRVAMGRAAGGRGGGRGGRVLQGAAFEAQRNQAKLSDAMISLQSSRSDSLVNSCWIPLDEQAGASRQGANEAEGTAFPVLRFIPSVVTDLTASPPSVRAVPPSVSAELRPVPASARIQNTTAHAKDDSTFVAEWLTPEGRVTQLTFRVHNDTLRGTTSAITGNLAITGVVFVAVQARCPQ
jgi:hypothetical protein